MRRHFPRRVMLLTVAATAALTASVMLRPVEAVVQPVRINAKAPELTQGQWINTPDSKPITLSSLRGKVVVVHFWTFG